MNKLPKINLPSFTIQLLSIEKPISYTPMTLREEKILLVAKESDDVDQMVKAVKQILQNCVVDDIDINELPLFDIEYLLINVVSKSSNDKFEFKFKDSETGEDVNAIIDIAEIKIQTDPSHVNPIDLGEDIYLQMIYPSVDGLVELHNANNDPVKQLNMIIRCIEKIYIKDVVYQPSDISEEDLIEFLDGMTKHQLETIEKFFTTMPVLRFEFKYKNANGVEKSLVIEGIRSFFTYR